MASLASQDNLEFKDGWRNIGIYCHINRNEWINLYNETPDAIEMINQTKHSNYKTACTTILENFLDGLLEYMPDRNPSDYHFKVWDLLSMYNERKKRKGEFTELEICLNSVGVQFKDITEIWYGNSRWNQHFFYLCKDARFVAFEHGIAEPKFAAIAGQHPGNSLFGQVVLFAKYCKRLIKKKIQEKLLYYAFETKLTHQYVSLLADEIKQINPTNNTINKLEEVVYLKVIKNHQHQIYDQYLPVGNNMLVYIDYFEDLNDIEKLKILYRQFENYLINDFGEIFEKEKIKNIFIKACYFREEYASFCVESLVNLPQKYNVLPWPPSGSSNYAGEYYLPIIKPRILISPFSSSSLYFKKLIPEIVCLSYDEWLIYQLDKLYKETKLWTRSEKNWQIEFYVIDNYTVFNNILPDNMKSTRNSH